jgi:CO/xanthine dehydrogenase Mo-binding subunit
MRKTAMTPDARAADMTPVALAALNRRNFLKSTGALIVGFRMAAGDPAQAQFGQAPLPGAPPMDQVDSWIAIGADGSITAYSGKEELGQGISTAQQQLVAEELSVPFERVKLIYCDTALTPDQAYTSGSQSHPANFNHGNLALAGATAREVLFKMASQRLEVPVERLTASNGVIGVKGDASKKVSYGQLVGSKKFAVTLDKNAKRKPASEWTVLGKPIGRPDMAAMATGQFEYVHNVRLPGMLHGRVVRPPAVGATLIGVDESSVKDMPGLVKVVTR